MKTLIIISHPSIEESQTQQFLKESLPAHNVTWHHLEELYPDGKIIIQEEQRLLLEQDRILFQFPFYWYSAPALLKQWQDMVFTEGFALPAQGGQLTGREFGLVLTTGVRAEEYQAGRAENYTVSELTRPYQAFAEKCGLTYLPPLVISQFDYMTEEQKQALLIAYRQYLTKPNDSSFQATEQWFQDMLATLGKEGLSAADQALVDQLLDVLDANKEQLEELNWTLRQMKK